MRAVSLSPARAWAIAHLLHPSARTAWWMTFVLLTAIGGLWAVSSPLMSIPDEPAHVVKAVALAHGQLRGPNVRKFSTDSGIPGELDTYFSVPRAYADLNQQPSCYIFSPHTPAGCAPTVETDATLVEAATYTGTYPPLYYTLVGWPSRLLSPYRALYAMRLCSVLLGAALLASAFASVRQMAPGGAGMAAFALSVTPIVVFLIGSVNPSGFEIAAALATWAALFDLVLRRGVAPVRLVARVVIATTCFAAARPLSPVFLVLVLGTVFVVAATRERLTELRHDRNVVVGAVVVLAGLVISSGWILWSGAYDSFTGVPLPGLTFSQALRHAVGLEPWHTLQMFGVFGWLDTPAPWGLALPWLLVVAVMTVTALVLGTGRQRLVLTSWLAVCIAIPLVAEADRAARSGYFWQGRYGLPLGVGVTVLAGWIIAASQRAPTWAVRIVALVAVAGMAIAQLLAHGIALTRYIVAVPGRQPFAYLDGGHWRPPLSPWMLFLAAVLIFAAYGAWLVLVSFEPSDRRAGPHASDRPGPPVDSVAV